MQTDRRSKISSLKIRRTACSRSAPRHCWSQCWGQAGTWKQSKSSEKGKSVIWELPWDEDRLSKVVSVSPTVLENSSWKASPNLSSINHQLACFIIPVVDHPPKSIESLSDGCVYVGPHVLWQEVLVLWEVGRQVALPGVKVAVESSVRDHGRGNVGVRTWGNWNHVGSPGVSQVTLLRA